MAPFVGMRELVVLAKLEAMRAGLELEGPADGRGQFVLSGEALSLEDACGVLALMRGAACCEHVRRFADV